MRELAKFKRDLGDLAVFKPIVPGFDQLYPGDRRNLIYNSEANNRTHEM